MGPMTRWLRRHGWVVVLAVTAGAIGRGFFPPFVLDHPFWREFWTGPPAAGVFALAGAAVAYLAARVAATTARRGAERQEWWDRAEWALDLARSDKESDRLIGLRALEALGSEATGTELQMVLAVTEAVVGDDGLDTVSRPPHTGGRRWWPWSRR